LEQGFHCQNRIGEQRCDQLRKGTRYKEFQRAICRSLKLLLKELVAEELDYGITDEDQRWLNPFKEPLNTFIFINIFNNF
jgi:hypothetical protein